MINNQEEVNIEELKTLDWHDSNIEKLVFDISSNTIILTLSEYKEELNEYLNIDYIFKNIKNLKFNDFLLNDFDELEVYSKDISILSNEIYNIKLMILTGFGKQSLDMEFSFEKIYMSIN